MPRFLPSASVIAATVFVVATSVAGQTISLDDPKARARAAYDEAERAAADLRFAEALAAYDQAIALDPSAPFVRVARARAQKDFAPARLD